MRREEGVEQGRRRAATYLEPDPSWAVVDQASEPLLSGREDMLLLGRALEKIGLIFDSTGRGVRAEQ